MTNQLAQISQAKRAIEAATTPDEANEARARLKAIQKYLAKRGEEFDTAFEAAKLQCEAAAKAGQLWGAERPGKEQNASKTKQTFASFSDAGFANSQDATICVRLGELDPQDVALYLDDMQDKRRYPTENGLHSLWKQLNFVEDEDRPWLRVYNIWNFAKCDDRFGISHPGMIPGQVMQNLNWYFTEPGDLVVDLFAGGGSTIDVCQFDHDDFGRRRCEAYDIDPKRPDIMRRDLLTDGLPDVSGAGLVFLDPPYWGQKQGEYGNQPTNLANLGIDDFHDALAGIVKAALSCPGYVALIIGASQLDGSYRDHAAEMIRRIQAAIAMRVIVPYSTEQYQAFAVARAKQNRRALNLYRDLIVWEAAR